MNSRAVSLPDLATDRKRNSVLSLSEGFTGANRNATLASSAQCFATRPIGAAQTWSGDDGSIPSVLKQILPIYYRTRQLVLEKEKDGNRAPTRLLTELKSLEKAVGNEMRPLHPMFFQRFNSMQLDRLIRAMPFLKLAQGRWIFGAEELAEAWPTERGCCGFFLLYGKVALFSDPSGVGDRREVTRGAIFGEDRFHICEETVMDQTAGAAYCEEACIVGCLSLNVLETAFADRCIGNKRMAQLIRKVPALGRITRSDDANEGSMRNTMRSSSASFSGHQSSHDQNEESRGLISNALGEMAKLSSSIHVQPGEQVLIDAESGRDPIEENILIVAKGGIEVRGDMLLEEKFDAIPPKKVRVNVHIDRGEKMRAAGWDIFDKLDPYCVVKLGEGKKFQTVVHKNAGENCIFNHDGILTYNGEDTLEFGVWDHDMFSADDLVGTATMSVKSIPNGWKGKLELTRPKQGIFSSDEALTEVGGNLYVKISYDFEKVSTMMRDPERKVWRDQVLFTLGEQEIWGHEQLMLGPLFRRTLEGAAGSFAYALKLGQFRIVGQKPRGAAGTVICWKVSRKRFLDFTKKTGREKEFVQSCRLAMLEKQGVLRDVMHRLVKRWEQEKEADYLRTGAYLNEKSAEEELIEPSFFKSNFRGCKAHIIVRNASNLVGGSLFDKLDPYAKVSFRGSRKEVITQVLQDAGSDPIWNCTGELIYNGESALDISVWDWDKWTAHDKLAVGVLQLEDFCNNFESMVPLALPNGKRKKNVKQMCISIGITFERPQRDPNATSSATTQLLNGTF